MMIEIIKGGNECNDISVSLGERWVEKKEENCCS